MARILIGYSLSLFSMRRHKMNNSFNYSNFIDMFLYSDDEFEPYGFVDDLPAGTDMRHRQDNQPQHRESLVTDLAEE